MKNDDKWIKNLRNRLDGYSEPLPEGFWNKLEKDLPAPRVIPLWRRNWRRTAVAAALLLAAGCSLTWWLSGSDFVEETALPQPVAQAVQPDPGPPLPSVSVSRKPTQALAVRVRPEVEPESSETGDAIFLSSAAGDTVAVEILSDEAVSETAEGTTSVKYRQREADRRTMARNQELLAAASADGKRKWTVGLSAGNMPYGSSGSYGGISRLDARSYSDAPGLLMASSLDQQVTYAEVLLNNRDKASTTHINHKMPVSVGLSVKWDLSGRWAMETGLVYTMLSSELRSGEISYLEEEQRLHYLGIPLKLHCSLWENRRLSVYASAGGMVEKCVSGSQHIAYVNGNVERQTEHRSLSVSPLQWSLLASAGIQFNIVRQVGIYAEPGVAYYFDDDSGVETIRKEHPVNFNLQVGVRFCLSR